MNFSIKNLHLKNYCSISDPYGIPYYFSSLIDIDIIKEAKEMRKRYYKNNARLSGILVVPEGASGNLDEFKKDMESQKKSKNFSIGVLEVAGGNSTSSVQLFDSAKSLENGEYIETIRVSMDAIHTAHKVPRDLVASFIKSSRDRTEVFNIFFKTTIKPILDKIDQNFEKFNLKINFIEQEME